jgi:hypothetical protein
MPDNAFLVKNKYVAGCFNEEKIILTQFMREELKLAGQDFT